MPNSSIVIRKLEDVFLPGNRILCFFLLFPSENGLQSLAVLGEGFASCGREFKERLRHFAGKEGDHSGSPRSKTAFRMDGVERSLKGT